MRHEDQRAAVVDQCVEQHFLGIQIKVVRRFVEQQRVRRPQQHARHREARAFASRQHLHLLENVVAREQEPAEDVPDHRHHVHRRAGRQRVVHGRIRVHARRLVLREVLHDQVVTGDILARVWQLLAREHAHQRRLAGAVVADQRDAVAALDVQVQVGEDHELTVGLVHVLQLEHRAAALLAHGEVEADLLPLGRHFDRHHFLEHLDAALHLRSLRRLVAEPIDEHLDAPHFLVLLALRLAHRLDARVMREEVVAVVADVVGQRAQREVGDAGDDGIEEEAIVRDEDDGMRVGVQVLLEPVARLEVEVVGRFVEEQQVRLLQQQLGERDAHLPAAREGFGLALEVAAREAEALQDGRGLQLDRIAVTEAEAILEVAVAAEHRSVFRLGDGRVAQAVLEDVHLRLHREQIGEGAARFFEHRLAGVVEAVLRQVADRQRRRLEDRAGVRLVEAGHHLQQRGLAGAVGSAEADALAHRDLPRHMVEQDATAEGLGEV